MPQPRTDPLMNYIDDIAHLRRISATFRDDQGGVRPPGRIHPQVEPVMSVVQHLESRAKNDRSPHRCRHRAGIMGRGIAHAAALAVIAPFSKIFCECLRRPRLKSAPTSIKPWNSQVNAAEATPLSRASNTPARLTKRPPGRSRHRSRPEEWNRRSRSSPCLTRSAAPPRFSLEYVLAQRHRNRQRHLSRQKCVGMHFFNPVHK